MRNLLYMFASLALLLNGLSTQAQISGRWQLVGPIQFPYDSSWWQINGIGRIEQIKFDPVNPTRVYCTSSGGGLFVSNDSCASWQSTGTDSAAFGNTSGTAASVCIDYTNDSILYLGTGDANYYGENYGIWKSTNAGATWAPANRDIGSRLAVEILMSPFDHNTLIAATDNGIWKTTNGGTTWAEKLDSGQFTDMQFKPDVNTNTLYAASYSAFYVSTDMGETWSRIALPGPVLSIQGGGRIGVTRADTDLVYVTFVGNDSALCTPLLKSTNSGQTFTIAKPADSCDLNGYDSINYGQYYQGNYNYSIIVSPVDPNTIYISAESVWKSTDGGAHWSTSFGWWEGVHCDMHYFAYNPLTPKILYNANDGGVWKTTDSNTTWEPVSNGLSTSEFYNAACSPINKNFVVGGLQDNGGIFYNNPNWDTFVGGDYTDVLAMNNEDSTTFYDMQGDQSQQFITNYWWLNFPQQDSNDYRIAAFPVTDVNTAFIADSDIYRSVNLNSNPPAWTKISNINEPMAALASSYTDANVLYAGDQNNNFYYTKNALAASPGWAKYSTPGPTYNGACIAPVKSDSNVVYMSCGSSVYRSANSGASWTNVSGSLPSVNIINLYNDKYSTNEAMYLATADAVWYKDNTMSNWLNFSKGLPNTCWITDLMLYNDGTANSVARVSFYGRGVWESPLYSTILQSVPSIWANNATVKIYPNPNTGTFELEIGSYLSGTNYTIDVYNLVGQNIFSNKLTKEKTEINLGIQPAGLYIYKVLSQSGEFVASGKILVE